MTVLEARELSCGYGDRRVIDGLSLTIRPGEILALVGPNGAGKTTLLKALGRLLRPSGGTVLLHGRSVWERSPADVARCLAIMPQSERRETPLTVEEAVTLGRAAHRGWLLPFNSNDRQIVDSVLGKTRTLSLRDRPITELSGGEWRRVVLARALAQQPKVLLLDEPTSGLDLRFQIDVLRLIRQLTETEQLSVVVTLHDLNLAAIYGSRVAILSDQKVVACGTAKEVLTAELIRRVFDVSVLVSRHPAYQTPLIIPLVE